MTRSNSAFLGVMGVGLGACLPTTPFRCEDSSSCVSRGDVGVCEVSGFCSYPDDGCASSRRYDEFAASELAEQCVPIATDGPLARCGNGQVEEPETCDDANTEDGDGCNSDCQSSGRVLWNVVHPELGGVARGVSVGPDGVIAVAGARERAGGSDILVITFNAEGVAQWLRTHPGEAGAPNEGRRALFDEAGNVYVVGHEFVNSTDPPQDRNLWMRAFDPIGEELWTRSYNSNGDASDRPWDATISGSTLLVAARHDNPGQALLAGFDLSNGEDRWIQGDGIDPDAPDSAQAIEIVGDTVYAAGTIVRSDERTDAWFARFRIAGDTLVLEGEPINWPAAGDSFRDAILDLAVTPDGNLLAGGRRSDRSWVAVLEPDGAVQWERMGDEGTFSEILGVAVDSAGQLVAAGTVVRSEGNEDAFVTKLSPDGATIWTVGYDGPSAGDDRARALAVAPDRSIIVAGFAAAVDGQRLWVRKHAP